MSSLRSAPSNGADFASGDHSPRTHPPSHRPQQTADPAPGDQPSPSDADARASFLAARRMLAVFAGAVIFLGIASLIKPEPRAATAGTPSSKYLAAPSPPRISGNRAGQTGWSPDASADISTRLAQTPHPQGWRLIGELEGTEYRVLMYASPDGPRYSIYSLAGKLLMPDLAADDVYRAFPTLDLSTLRDLPTDGSKAIMLAEPIE